MYGTSYTCCDDNKRVNFPAIVCMVLIRGTVFDVFASCEELLQTYGSILSVVGKSECMVVSIE